ncbi:MAG: hypothetical protein HY429_01170 [Candidatus Levybacteria bacterium]|nr:hypothetical protein [Candidatus Levybacteria bacterium]
MNYVTTNIRISEEDYLRLKAEAAKKRKSLSAVVREKIGVEEKTRSEAKAKKFMEDLKKIAKENAKYHRKGWDSVKILREMRYENT